MDTQVKNITPEDHQGLPAAEKKIVTYWQVEGIAECTYKVTGGPHDGLVGRCFLPVKQTVMLDPKAAYKTVRKWLIDRARELTQKDLGAMESGGYFFGDWFGEITVTFVRKDYQDDETNHTVE